MALLNEYVLNEQKPVIQPKTFSLIDKVNAIWLDLSTTLANARKMFINHRQSDVKGKGLFDQHQWGFTQDVIGNDGITRTLKLNITSSVPRHPSITEDHVINAYAMGKEFHTEDVIKRLMVNDR